MHEPPSYDHQRNGQDDAIELIWLGRTFGEILPEDIDQFAVMRDVEVDEGEWMSTMRKLSEAKVKEFIAKLLLEPVQKDWGGESQDHFSANVSINGRRKTAAFLLKGPSQFREMTLESLNGRHLYG